jgi:hypothetical protein
MNQTIRTNFCLQAGNNQIKKYPVILDVDASHVDISFGFNDLLREEIKRSKAHTGVASMTLPRKSGE